MEQRAFSGLGCSFQRYAMARGDVIARHNHEVDHLTIVAAGRAIARTDERSLERGPADAPILFRAGRFHEIEALEDGTVVLNVFSGEMVS